MLKIFIFFFLTSLVSSCNNTTTTNPNIETARQGSFKITADESFKPIIDSQIDVFLSEYPKINIKVEYKPEAECFKALDEDSATRLIITTRGLTTEEDAYYKSKFSTGMMYDKVANDGIAVILNPAAKDSFFSKKDLQEILLGTSKYKYKPVFDGLKETSSLRFMLDSILHQSDIPKSITGMDSTIGVINYVARNPNSIGFVGVSWIGNDQDAEQVSFLRKVKVASILSENTNFPGYKKPYQAKIATKEYPLVRSLYYIVKNDYGGVATNFAKWLEQERGQLIFKSAFLVPTKMQVFVQETQVIR
jgi:phosphate transport system substrate-binding protein